MPCLSGATRPSSVKDTFACTVLVSAPLGTTKLTASSLTTGTSVFLAFFTVTVSVPATVALGAIICFGSKLLKPKSSTLRVSTKRALSVLVPITTLIKRMPFRSAVPVKLLPAFVVCPVFKPSRPS
ncbi:hypothetical protein D1872_244620 [compost metagenome]